MILNKLRFIYKTGGIKLSKADHSTYLLTALAIKCCFCTVVHECIMVQLEIHYIEVCLQS